jgi:hypothetical protein
MSISPMIMDGCGTSAFRSGGKVYICTSNGNNDKIIQISSQLSSTDEQECRMMSQKSLGKQDMTKY